VLNTAPDYTRTSFYTKQESSKLQFVVLRPGLEHVFTGKNMLALCLTCGWVHGDFCSEPFLGTGQAPSN
jgi:hypothetical protein